jgi:hypothetical protein
MTLGGSAHSAPFGFSGIFTSGSSFSGVSIEKAMERPSGDQLSEAGERGNWVSRAVWPESIHRT